MKRGRRYLPDVVVMLLLLIIAKPHVPLDLLPVIALAMLFQSVLAGGMAVLGACALLLAFWGWLGGNEHKETACELALDLMSPWFFHMKRVEVQLNAKDEGAAGG
jgi:hypothetical protein